MSKIRVILNVIFTRQSYTTKFHCMKQKFLPKFLLFVFLAVVAKAPLAQTIQLTNGGSTTLSGSTSGNPVSAYFEYMRFQVVYTAAEINAAGVSGSKILTQLGWYISTAPASALPSYKIRMANTTATNSAAHDASALTEVYSSASYAPVAGGFDMLTLNGAFTWDGTSNLLVDVCFGAAPYVSPYGEVRTYAATTTSGSRRVRCDACGSQCGNNTNTTNTFKPQVSLTFTTPSGCSGVPSAGTISGPANACTGVAFTLTNTGATTGTGMKYAWQSSANGVSGWANIPGQTNALSATVTQTALTYYRFVDTCNAVPNTAISNVISVGMNGFLNCYCTPTYASGCSGDNIASDSLGTLQDNGLTCTPVYEDRSSQQPGTLAIPSLNAGTTVNLKITFGTDGNQYNGVWIDFNQNGTFEASEYFTSGTNAGASGTVYVAIAIPPGATAGNTKMRIRGGDDSQPTSGQACDAAASAYGSARDYLVNIVPSSNCSGTPSAPVVSGPAAACTGVNFTLTATGYPSSSGVNYAWQSSANGTSGWTNIAGQTNPASASVSQTAVTYYRLVDTCTFGGGNNISNVVQVNMTTSGCPPPNDLVCNAITLSSGGAQDCQNTTLATSSGDPAMPGSCSSPNNTVWYKYTPAASGTVIVRTEIPGASAAPLHGWIGWYTATGTCPSPGLTLTAVAGSSCGEFGQTLAGDVDSLTSPALTGGTTYYIVIDGFSGAFGEYCISLVPPPPPPSCVANVTPANGATGVAIAAPNGSAPITWNAATGASSYDVYFGTVNPPTALIGNVAAPAVTANITGLQYDTTYYWYVVPKNTGGAATGCVTNTTSFTVQSAPTNCVPLTSSGCSLSDRIDIFRLKGESSEININTGTTCFAGSYVDSTDYATVIDMARGKTYWGQIKAGTTGDYVSIWIDANDNGLFENSERLINNIPVLSTGTGTNINLFIPLGTTLGTHRMRVRLVYYSPAPTAPTTPCGFYTYSDTRDYPVNIVAGGSSYTVASYTPSGSCYTSAGQITVDAASNNNSNYVPLVDSSNALIAQLYPQGNNLGTVTPSYYKHNGPVRQDPSGRYYMDRNLTITVATQPTSSYNLRFPYQNSELNALIAQPGSGVTDQFSLNMTKNPDACLSAIGGGWPGVLYSPTGFGSIGGDRFVDVTNITGGFSSFYLHGGSTPVPVKVEYFKGAKQGADNLLDWKVSCTNTPSATLTLERSADSRNFGRIYSITATALRCQQPFSYTDSRSLPGMNYYRLKMEDANGVVTYSSIVALLNRDKGFEMVNITPNPVTDGSFKLNISASQITKMQVIVADMQGRMLSSKAISLTAGFNAIDMNVSNLAKGTYQVYGVTDEMKTKALSFVKQ